MSFSATGNILSGSRSNPNYETIIETVDTLSGTRHESTACTNRWNALGYTPIVSTVTGCGRILIATAHAIVHVAAAVFDGPRRSFHLAEVRLAVRNVARGAVELLPVIGNLALLFFDISHWSTNANRYLGVVGTVALIADGREVAHVDCNQYHNFVNSGEVSFIDRVRFLRQFA